jgi:hypothetical protein
LAGKKGSPNYSGASKALLAFQLSTIRKFCSKYLTKQHKVFAWTRFSFKYSKAFIELGWPNLSLAFGADQLPYF